MPSPARRAPGSVAVAWVLAECPLLIALGRLARPSSHLLVIGSVTALGLLATRLRWWNAPTAAAAVFGGFVLVAHAGPRAALLAVAAAVCWALTMRVVPLRPSSIVDGGTLLVGPLVVAIAVLVGADSLRWASIALAVASVMAIVVVASPRATAGVGEITSRVGAVTGRVVGAVAALPAALVISVMSILYSAVRFDPLELGRTTRAEWRPRSHRPHVSRHGYGPLAVHRPSPSAQRRRRLAHVSLSIAVVVTIIAVATRPPGAPESSAFAAEPWWPDVWAEQAAFNSSPIFDNTTVWRLKDFEGQYVNQENGVRRTWTPPACACRRLTIWWFGGSAAWGFYQRDDDTIPSRLARAAWDQGIALDIANLAVPGFAASQEMQLFAQMTVTRPRPDLAIFYDGANELYLQINRNGDGRGADESPATFAEKSLDTVFDIVSLRHNASVWDRAGESAPNPGPGPILDAPQVAEHALNRYRDQAELIDRLAAEAGIDTLLVWQPVLSTAPAVAADQWEPFTADGALWHERLTATGRALLPPGTLDLSDVFDDVDAPIFPDWAHTNADGADRVGRQLLDELLASGTIDPVDN